MKNYRKYRIRSLCRCALGAAVLCVLAPITIPSTPTPITLSLFALYLTATVLSPKEAVSATACYIALGAVGLPVFSGFMGGFHVLAGPTGGFVLGYLPAVLIVSVFKNGALKKLASMAAATVLCYLLGSLWLSFAAGSNFLVTLLSVAAACAVPDALKIACVTAISRKC